MNAPHAIDGPHAVMFTVDDFRLLKRSGAFDNYSKSELINGELSGVPHRNVDGTFWLSDASVPIGLRVIDYEMLAATGSFDAVGKTELLNGIVYAMSPQHRAHGYATSELVHRLRSALQALASPLYVAFERSVDLASHSEPQPDIILTTESRGDGAIPAASVALLAEVSVSTRAYDFGDKAMVYAAAGVPEYWVVDVRAETIHKLWSPAADGYRRAREVAFGEQAESITIVGLKVETGELV